MQELSVKIKKLNILSQKYVNASDIAELLNLKSGSNVKSQVFKNNPLAICCWDTKYIRLDEVLKFKKINKDEMIEDLTKQVNTQIENAEKMCKYVLAQKEGELKNDKKFIN